MALELFIPLPYPESRLNSLQEDYEARHKENPFEADRYFFKTFKKASRPANWAHKGARLFNRIQFVDEANCKKVSKLFQLDFLAKMFNSTCIVFGREMHYINYLFSLPNSTNDKRFQAHILSKSGELGRIFEGHETKQARAQMIMRMLFPALDEKNPNYLNLFIKEILKIQDHELQFSTCVNIITLLCRLNSEEDKTTIPLIELLKERQARLINENRPLLNAELCREIFSNWPHEEAYPLYDSAVDTGYDLLITLFDLLKNSQSSFVHNRECLKSIRSDLDNLLRDKMRAFFGEKKASNALIHAFSKIYYRCYGWETEDLHSFLLNNLNFKLLQESKADIHDFIPWLKSNFPSMLRPQQTTLHHLLANPELRERVFGFSCQNQNHAVDFFDFLTLESLQAIKQALMKPFFTIDALIAPPDGGAETLESFFRMLAKDHCEMAEIFGYFFYQFETLNASEMSELLNLPLREFDEAGLPQNTLSFEKFKGYFLAFLSQKDVEKKEDYPNFTVLSEEAKSVIRLFATGGETSRRLTKRAQKPFDLLEPDSKKIKIEEDAIN